jgi:hypothetical protein
MTGRMERVRQLALTKPEVCAIEDFVGPVRNGRNDISTLELEFDWSFEKSWATHGYTDHKHYALVRVGRTERAPRQAIQQRLITT